MIYVTLIFKCFQQIQNYDKTVNFVMLYSEL